MNCADRDCPQPYLASFWGGILAVGMLWMLAIWNIGANADANISNIEHSNAVATQDFRLHASGDYSPSVKRFYSRYQDQSSPVKFSDPQWKLASAAINNLLPVSILSEQNSYAYFPAIRLHQLQALNTPRAPPLL